MQQHRTDPGKRIAQHLLASELIELVHGAQAAQIARREHQSLRAPSLASLLQSGGNRSDASDHSASGSERITLPRSSVSDLPWSQILLNVGIAKTKSEGARMLAAGGVYVASRQVDDSGPESTDVEKLVFTSAKALKPEDIEKHIIGGNLIVLRLGKWKVRIIELT